MSDRIYSPVIFIDEETPESAVNRTNDTRIPRNALPIYAYIEQRATRAMHQGGLLSWEHVSAMGEKV